MRGPDTIEARRLALHDRKIADARAAQIEARRRWAHSPTTQNVAAEEQTQARVDDLLDRRPELARRAHAEAMVTS